MAVRDITLPAMRAQGQFANLADLTPLRYALPLTAIAAALEGPPRTARSPLDATLSGALIRLLTLWKGTNCPPVHVAASPGQYNPCLSPPDRLLGARSVFWTLLRPALPAGFLGFILRCRQARRVCSLPGSDCWAIRLIWPAYTAPCWMLRISSSLLRLRW